MDALPVFLVAGVLFGVSGFVLGRVQRELRWRREAARNLALANSRASRSDAVTVPDDDDDHGTVRTVQRETGRRAIPRTDVGSRPGRYAARGGPRGADASAMIRVRPPRLEFDCDRG